MPLRGRGAVVTGGGRGIGAAIARELAKRGASVVATARSLDQVETIAGEIVAAGGRAFAVAADVTDPDQVSALRHRAEAELDSVDLLVNNAGAASSAPLERIALEEWNRLFTVNATSALLCTQAFLPGMVERGWGRVVNIASIAGKVGSAYTAAYTAAKHAVVGLTRAVAAEYPATGVTVNAVCPGYVRTELTEETVRRIVDKTGMDEEKVRARLAEESPQGRIYEPEEVAYLTASLCDPRAGGVHGQAILLDGGTLQS